MRPPTDDKQQHLISPNGDSRQPLGARTRTILSSAINRLVINEASRRLDEQYNTFSHQSVEIDEICSDLSEMGAFDTSAEIERIQQMRLTRREAVFMFEKIATALGKKWEDDDGDFLDVTIGMARLQAVLRGYVEAQIVEPPLKNDACEVLIATMPGEAHTFAAILLELNMRLIGWNTTLFCAQTHKEFARKVEANCYDVICLSWTTLELTDSLADLTRTISGLDIDTRPILIAGGLASEKRGKWLARVGVDYICDTAVGAIDVVREAISNNARSSNVDHARSQQHQHAGGLA